MNKAADFLFYFFITGVLVLAIYALACLALWLFDRFKEKQ